MMEQEKYRAESFVTRGDDNDDHVDDDNNNKNNIIIIIIQNIHYKVQKQMGINILKDNT